MIYLFVLSLAVFGAFIVAMLLKYGVPTSISESYYLLPDRVAHPTFAGFCLLTALPLMIFWLDCTADTTFQFLVFFACAPLLFVGAAAAFKAVELTRRVHFTAAIICGVASQLWVVINTWWWIASIVLFAAAFVLASRFSSVDSLRRKKSSLLFFVEVAAFLSTYVAVFAYYIAA